MQVKTQRKSLKNIKATICLFNNGELSLYVKGYTANVKDTLQGEPKDHESRYHVMLNHFVKPWLPHKKISWLLVLALCLSHSLCHTMSFPSSAISPVLAVTFRSLRHDRQTQVLSIQPFDTSCFLSSSWDLGVFAAKSFSNWLLSQPEPAFPEYCLSWETATTKNRSSSAKTVINLSLCL